MANTYTLIASSTVGSGGAATIDFTSIPSTYTDLLLFASTRPNGTDTWINISFNGSTSNFTSRRISADGSSASSASESTNFANLLNGRSSYTANTFSNAYLYIPNYAGSNNKSFSTDSVNENNATEAVTALIAGLRSNTAAITQITLTPNSGSFVQYSTAYLYGIKNS
jgi:hypothetical protein